MPSNADPTRTHLNQRLVEYPEGVDNRTLAIQHRLDNAGLKRKIANNQVRAICINLSGSPEDMKQIEQAGQLDHWCADNLDWLSKTFGTANIVSADLHMDETTPHIHATIVPIVTGERRKAKAEQQSDKKKYRKKSTNTARLCADDVMTRDNLKTYQNTYAEAMAKYGLQRGIDGSEARHTTTLEYYRDLVVKNKTLQENVESLREQQTDAKQELSKARAEVSREKFKNTAAEVGSNLIEGIGAVIGTSKVKKQQQEIEGLKADNQDLRQEITGLKQTITRERRENDKVIVELKAEHATITDKLRQELKKIYDLFPHIKDLLNWENFLQTMRLPNDMIKQLFNKEEVRGSGNLFSTEHSKNFKAENATLKLEQDPEQHSKIRLTINGTDIFEWFKEKNQEFLKSIGINIQPKQDRGIKR